MSFNSFHLQLSEIGSSAGSQLARSYIETALLREISWLVFHSAGMECARFCAARQLLRTTNHSGAKPKQKLNVSVVRFYLQGNHPDFPASKAWNTPSEIVCCPATGYLFRSISATKSITERGDERHGIDGHTNEL